MSLEAAETVLLLVLLISAMAFLYASVGHAGASGYIAIMGLMSLPLAVIRPTSLFLNIIVALIGANQFLKNKHFDGKLFWPLVAASVPSAFWGASLALDAQVIKSLLGGILLISAGFFAFRYREVSVVRSAPTGLLVVAGAAIGFLSGLTGTGGGIFLTPLLLVSGWSRAKVASGVSVVFILCNSISGILSYALSGNTVEPLWYLAIPVAAFGYLGARLGAHRFPPKTLFVFLAGVLVIASAKLVLGL